MQISLNIQDDVYKQLVNAGVDMQSKINEYLVNLVDKKDDYINSNQFQEDKAYFHEALEDIESGKARALSQEQYEKEMEAFEQSL
ncbi:hypothetical protein [Sulfurimonas sp.]|uniref:hypothetical protein n=1 Tax=Sulfurimonas sp. TaxID=2022749 RepID=UPI00260C6E0B|nr:hypothetical protein [Sulfurimonas sp.]